MHAATCKGQNLMTGALDGTVVLWSLQSLEPMFQAKVQIWCCLRHGKVSSNGSAEMQTLLCLQMPTAVKKLEFFGENDFMFVMGKEVSPLTIGPRPRPSFPYWVSLRVSTFLKVRVMWLQWIQTVFAEYDSPVKSLEYLGMVGSAGNPSDVHKHDCVPWACTCGRP